MTELLFGLTMVFVVYVLYEVFKTVSQSDGTQTHLTESSPAVRGKSPGGEASTPAAKVSRAAEATEKTVVLRDPKTGDTSPVPTNYRFAKKWIKEALVAEGLLKKVYKNSELTEAVAPQVKQALEKLKLIDKYHA